MIERMGEDDAIVTRYMSSTDFEGAAFPMLSEAIFRTVRERSSARSTAGVSADEDRGL